MIAPIRPFHIGLLCLLAIFVVNKEARQFFYRGPYLPIALGLCALLALQTMWVERPDRHLQYSLMLGIGFGAFLLAALCARWALDIRRLLTACVVFWFVLAIFPVFDAWTHTEVFRTQFLMTGGPWYNINNMGTALVFIVALGLLYDGKLSWPLFFASWLYAVALSRRADEVALVILGLGYLVFFSKDALLKKLQIAAIWALVTAAGLILLYQSDIVGALLATSPTLNETRALPTISLSSEAGIEMAGDSSSLMRLSLITEMLAIARDMPWWQWILGQGAGQLDLLWPVDDSRWASPHFFWLEMFFYVGIAWPLLLLWMLWRLDWRGRLAMLVMGMAGIAPSSLVYFQPFWFLFGTLFYKAFVEVPDHDAVYRLENPIRRFA